MRTKSKRTLPHQYKPEEVIVKLWHKPGSGCGFFGDWSIEAREVSTGKIVFGLISDRYSCYSSVLEHGIDNTHVQFMGTSKRK